MRKPREEFRDDGKLDGSEFRMGSPRVEDVSDSAGAEMELLARPEAWWVGIQCARSREGPPGDGEVGEPRGNRRHGERDR